LNFLPDNKGIIANSLFLSDKACLVMLNTVFLIRFNHISYINIAGIQYYMASQDYESFKGKFVKVLYNDSNKHAIARGTLSKETDRMILLEGDYSEIAIK